MKTKICILLALVVAAAPWAARLAYGQDGLQHLPANTQAVLTINSIEKLYGTFKVDELRAEYPDEFLLAKAEMIDELGVDLLDLKALREFGLDPGKPIYVGFVLDPAFATALLLPSVKDAREVVGMLLEEQGEQGAGFTKKTKAHGVDIYGKDDEEAAFFAKGSYIVVVITDEDEGGAPATEAAKNLLAATKKGNLAHSKKYKEVLDQIPGEADFTFYMGPEFYDKLLELEDKKGLEDQGVSEEEVEELYKRWGLSGLTAAAKARLESERLVVESRTWLDQDSEVLDWYRVTTNPTAFLARVPSDPMLAMVGRLNCGRIWESLQTFDEVVETDSIPDFDEALDDASEELGIDIDKALISQLNGNVALLVNNIQMMNNDAVILLQVERPQEFQETLKTLVEAIDESIDVNTSQNSGRPNPELVRDEYEGLPYYTFLLPPMVEVSFGVVEDHLVVASSRMRFQSIVKGSRGFSDEIGNDEISKALADPTGNVFYLDFQKIASNLQAWAPMLGEESFEIVAVLNEMQDLVGVSRLEDNGCVWQKMTFTGAQPDMWKRLLAAGIERVPDELEKESGDDQEDEDYEENDD
jgi:hypothetical protein